MAIKPGKYDPIKPDIELFDHKSKKRYGLKLEGTSALQIGTISQDDSVHVRSAGKRVGDFDEQRSWKQGRGHENLSSNPEGYWDSMNLWTLTADHAHPTLLWQFAKGIRNKNFSMPDKTHSMSWKQLLGTSLYMSVSWTATVFNADYARLWIRRIGSPGTLTLKLHSNSAGDPGTVLQTVTVTTENITDFISVLHKFDWTGTQALTATTFHISIYGDTADNKNNHWEVGGYAGGSVGKMSTNGSSWSAASFDPYYVICDADVSRQWFSFFLDGAMYVTDRKDSGTSQLFINGDRGKATSGTTTSLTQTGKTWVTNQWAGAWVKIVRGTGVGTTWEITSNTSTALSFVAQGSLAPSSDSEYIIYATDYFTEITPAGLSVVTSTPIVVNQIVYFPQGGSGNIRRMIWNPATPAHSFSDDGTNAANFLAKMSTTAGVIIWRAISAGSLISKAPAVAWATSPTNLTFGTALVVGDTTYLINNLLERSGLLYIFKEDSVSTINEFMQVTTLSSGINAIPSNDNGKAVLAHQQFVYYSWLHSLIRVYGSSHDDVGQDWSGWGLPDGREGAISSLDSYTSLVIAGVDARNGTSSVLGWDGLGWHELLRAYDSALRVRMVKLQPCESTRNRLWTDIGGDFVFQEFPFQKGSPRLDSGVRYMHEAVLESSAIDMGTASGLPKFIKELTVLCDRLGDNNAVYVDYQVDDDVHTNNWTHATVLYESPEATAFLGLTDVRKFAYRLRIQSSDNTAPADLQGVMPNGYARTPYKMVWTMRCRADNVTSRGRLVKPDALMRWLLDNARFPGRLEMLSQFELAHKFLVIVHPPRMFPYKPAQNGMAEEAVFTLVLEEA